MISLVLLLILHSNLAFSNAQSQAWMRSGYWFSGAEFPVSDINSGLFTHLICAFADINSTTHELVISSSDQKSFSAFSTTVKQKNPSVVTLLSIGGGSRKYDVYSTMVNQSSYRKSFIDSSIARARAYGFQGLDFSWSSAQTQSDATNMGALFSEWRAAVESEARNNGTKLILTMAAPYSQYIEEATLPIELIRTNLDWVHVSAYDYYKPSSNREKTGPSAALYDPQSNQNTNFGITSWINGGLPAEKIVLGLPFYGYAWTLKDPKDNAIGAPANGSAFTTEGDMGYETIKAYIRQYNAVPSYDSTYVMSYFSVGTIWIGFDDVQVVKAKVSYARQKNLRGYVVWQVSHDANWELSQAAAEQNETESKKTNQNILLKILLPVAAVTILLLACIVWRMRSRLFMKKAANENKETEDRPLSTVEATYSSDDSYYAHAFSFDDIKAATNDFSIENKLGEGGYGPVYMGTLRNGQEIAVKRLSETSKQGIEEFKTEVLLTSRLQHINLVRVLGYCTERDEKMLIYEYMPNKSLDFYIYDPVNRFFLNWEKRVQIIEGVTQGLIYLQEYSRLTVIHRDLKGSNILLDNQMKPKISDFGMARMFQKDKLEANTDRVVGTYGYIPPEYVRGGIYSTKSDVFSFGVLLLQIISGKRITSFYGLHSNLTLLEHAYESWTSDKGHEFLDETLVDATSSCKLMTCFQIALQCVQEDPNDRPSMLEVSYMLRNETAALKHPKRPAFSVKVEGGKSSTSSTAGMMDTGTITEVVAR